MDEKMGYCVLAPALNVNCDFTLSLLVSSFLTLRFEYEASVYPYSVNSM
jgi:hypothetical protein